MIDIVKELSTVIIIIATIFNLWFVYQNWAIKKPVVEILVDTLPKYKSDQDKTVVTIKNVGEKATGQNPDVTISCSWMPNISYRLNFPTNSYNLEPKEAMIWKVRLDSAPPENSSIVITVRDGAFSWERHEQIT